MSKIHGTIVEEAKKIKWILRQIAKDFQKEETLQDPAFKETETKITFGYFEDQDLDAEIEDKMNSECVGNGFMEFTLLYAKIQNKKVHFEMHIEENGNTWMSFTIFDPDDQVFHSYNPEVEKEIALHHVREYLFQVYYLFIEILPKTTEDFQAVIEKQMDLGSNKPHFHDRRK